MAEEKKKRKRKGVTAAPEAKAPEEPKPAEAEKPAAVPSPRHKVVVELDDSEYQLIRTYAKLYNEEHEGIEGFTKLDEAQYLLVSTLHWVEYTERLAASGSELGEEEDQTPPEPAEGKAPAVSPADPVEDDPEFVEAFTARIAGSPT